MLKIEDKKVQEFQRNGFLLLKNRVSESFYKPILDIAKVHLRYKIEPIESEHEYMGIW